MLLTITTTYRPATDLGYLLHKNPARCQEFELTFGKAYVFFPEATGERCTAALLLDIDPVGMVRGRNNSAGGLIDQYVNDRPYAASSFLSVAISEVFGSTLRGQAKERQQLAETPLPLTVRIPALPCRRGGSEFLRKLFEPLGYIVQASRLALDVKFPEWGEGPYFAVEISGTITLKEMLTHIYVLIPVLDNSKHYYVGDDEVEKLLRRGEGWLGSHPEKEAITSRYLKFQSSLAREALARLAENDDQEPAAGAAGGPAEEDSMEKTISLNDARLGSVVASLKGAGARSVLDLGCGEGKLVRELLKEKQFERILAMDVSIRSLEKAHERLHLETMPDRMKERLSLIHGSLLYRDKRLQGFDAAALVEVIEHLDQPRLAAAERVVFEFARPRTVVVTTPNVEYNTVWKLPESGQKFRHTDHRFEWTRSEFQAWAREIAGRFGYTVSFLPVGPEDQTLGSPTQMGVFHRE